MEDTFKKSMGETTIIICMPWEKLILYYQETS